MPHKNRSKHKRKARNEALKIGNKFTIPGGQFRTEEIEQLTAILKDIDLSTVPLIISLMILQKKEAILKLIKQGCDVNQIGPDQTTALMWCVQRQNLEFVEILLKHGANPSIQDANGNNILLQALENVSWEETTFLNLWELVKKTKKIDINASNKTGATLLHLSVKREWLETVKILIKEKGDVNMTNSSGATPLMLAAFRYNESLVQILIEAGADVLKKDDKGRTALCYAICTAIAKCLKSPFTIIDLLLSEMETRDYSLKDYLTHVVNCSSNEVLAHVVSYAVRHIPDGVRLLLEVDFFDCVLTIFKKYENDLSEQKSLLMVIAEVLSHDPTCEANKSFFSTILPQTCLEILQNEVEAKADTFLKTATVHLLILACGDTDEGAMFLKNNLKVILRNYDKCLENYLLQKYEHDDPTNETVHHKIKLFKEQLHRMKSETEILEEQSDEETELPDDGAILVTAIKTGARKLREELDKYKYLIMNLRKIQRLKETASLANLDFIIDYYEEILEKIILAYQSAWKINGDLQTMQNEAYQIYYLQQSFQNLTNAIRKLYLLEPTITKMILNQLENCILLHHIRGKAIIKILTEDDLIKSEECGDQLYYKEVSLLSRRKPPNLKLQKEAQAKTMENKYHLILSIAAMCEEEENFQIKRRNKSVILKNAMGMSRWCGVLEKLRRVTSSVQLQTGDIRMCNGEKRGYYIISTGGNFNPVEIGLDVNSRPLAIKRIPKSSNICRSLKLLIGPLLGVRNTHILQYFACDYKESELILATPLCEYNISEYMVYMRHNTRIPFLSSNTVASQFLSGLRFLHEFKEPIVHGNLKPSNIFIDLRGNVRIAEFGIYKLHEAPTSSTIWFARETYEIFKMTARVECTIFSDIHVAGMLLHFILTCGKHPYGDNAHEILMNLEKANPVLSIDSLDLQDLITWMLLYDPKERPTISQVLSHVFFWSPEKRWSFILTCSGIGTNASSLDIEEFHTLIKYTAIHDNIKANWVAVLKHSFPNLNCFDDYEDDDTPAGLLRFIRSFYENSVSFNINQYQLRGYILRSFPTLTLSLYRMLESTAWLKHPAFLTFIR